MMLFSRVIRLIPNNLRNNQVRVQSTSSKFKFRTAKTNELNGSRKYALLVVPATAFGLGVWQTQRRTWKLRLVQQMEEAQSQQPIPLPEKYVSSLVYLQHTIYMLFVYRLSRYSKLSRIQSCPRVCTLPVIIMSFFIVSV